MSAGEIEIRAAAWLARRDRDDWSAADQSALEAWLGESVLHRVAYWRLEAAWASTERLTVLRQPDRTETPPAPPRRFLPLFFRAVAALGTIAVLGIGATQLLQPAKRSYETAIGEHRTIRFADGSQIELNTDTKLSAEIGPSRRKVWLDRGEAYFQVKHDANNPFIVIAGDRYVTDLGTKFRIRRDPNRFEVALLEGRAQLETSDARATQKPIVLAPGDVATAHDNSISLTKMSTRNLAQELTWRQGIIVFNNTTLAAAAEEFNRYNRDKIIVADRTVAGNLIYGSFQTDNVAAFARLAREVLGLHVERRGDDIVISR